VSTIELRPEDEAEVEQFAGSLFQACLGTMELANVELGLRLGLYVTLADGTPRTAAELAAETGIVERYAREWLEQQAVSGVLDVDDPSQQAEARRYRLSPAHAHVLLEDDSEACMKPCAGVVPWVGRALDLMGEEFRRGGGIAFGDFDLHDLQAAFTRPVFANHLTQHWLPAVPEVQGRLEAGEAVRIAEVGCGEGLAAVTIAQRFPEARVDGFDLDPASIAAARRAAERAGVGDRARFVERDAADVDLEGTYDLVMAIEMLHDVPDPVGVLRSMRRLAGDTGAVVVVDERTEDEFTPQATEMERLFYAFSTLHCLSVSMQGGGAGTGTVLRTDGLRRYASEAGFREVEVLPVEHPQFRLYRLR
jgi:2-polyprenyl-3-methyl-5-hydroxy-6-metoxy-1,4-benzoquinol methylase